MVGDCDDFAIVLAALVESIGGRSRVVVANNAQSAHAYAEMFIGNKYEPTTSVITLALCVALKAVPSYDEEPNGDIWLNLDWSAKYPGGPFFPATNRLIVYPNGSFASA
jgi:transglutaminase-like putative cysteine protease